MHFGTTKGSLLSASHRQLPPKKKNPENIKPIAQSSSLDAYIAVAKNGVCIPVKYYGHLKGTHKAALNRKSNNLYVYRDISSQERERLWRNNPRYKDTCLKPFYSQMHTGNYVPERELISAVNEAFFQKRRGHENTFIWLISTERMETPGQRYYGSAGFDCKTNELLDTKGRNVDTREIHNLLYGELDSTHAKKLCSDPKIQAILSNPIK